MISPQWVNIDDAGALHVLLQRLASAVAVESIDALWILPTRRSAGIESTVIILSVLDPHDPLRRRVGAVRWLVTRDRKGQATVEEQMNEYALAPADALQRIVEGVMRRLGDSAIEPPQPRIVGGDPALWSELLRSLGAPPETIDASKADADADTDADADAPDPDTEAIRESVVASRDTVAAANS